MFIRSLLALVVAAGTLAAQETRPFEITNELLRAQVERLLPAIRAEFGDDVLERPVEVRIGTRREVRAALVAENRDLLRRFYGEEAGEERTRTFANATSRALVAKYVFESRSILVLPANLEAIAHQLEMPEVHSADGVFAILAHELVHAVDHDLWLEPETLYPTLRTEEEVAAFNAVLEGHAQLVARRLCARLGKAEAFESFTRLIGKAPPPEDEEDLLAELTMRVTVATMASAYYDGERFMAAVERAGGREAVERAFRSPPKDVMEIFEPAWFLDPESRPAQAFDLEAGLVFLERRFPESDWKRQRVTVTPAMILAGLAGFVSEEQAERLGRTLQKVAFLMVADAEDANRVLTFALVECRSPTDAISFHSINTQVLRAKDERFRTGPIQIVESSYEESARDGQPFLVARKRLDARGEQGSVATILSTRKALAVEFSYVNVEVESADGLALVREVIDAATRRGE